MLTAVTGNPGAGKSLYTILAVEKRRKAENRKVYCDGITGLVFPWEPLPLLPEKENGVRVGDEKLGFSGGVDWSKVEDGSMVVVDEAWRLFPVRGQSKSIPAYVQFLATHRHHGLDIYLTTQQVKTQLDTFVRGLVGEHVHMERKFNMECARKYVWPRLADPSSTKDIGESENALWTYPKDFYGTYQSATLHTHKTRLPVKKLAMLGIGIVGGVGLIAYNVHSFIARRKAPAVVEASGHEGAKGGASSKPGGALSGDSFWNSARLERVRGVPASAPIFDELQKVKSQARPSGCMELIIGKTVRCECTGPSGSKLPVALSDCLGMVKSGWFDETRSYPDVKAENIKRLDELSAHNATESSSASESNDKPAKGGG